MSVSPQESSITLGNMIVDRLRCDGLHSCLDRNFGVEDAFLVQTQVTDMPMFRLWRGPHLVQQGHQPARSITIRDVREAWREDILSACDRISFRIPFDSIRAFAAKAGRSEFSYLRCPDGAQDEALHGLAQALIPALEKPEQASRLFLDQVGLAVMAHLTQAYGGLHFPSKLKGGLAAWQEARATSFLTAHLTGAFSLDELANACGLSKSYFSKAFKMSFGKTPGRWLLEYRVSKARDLLRSDMPIVDIALACGFADQSHLTRSFAAIMHATPATWRGPYKENSHWRLRKDAHVAQEASL